VNKLLAAVLAASVLSLGSPVPPSAAAFAAEASVSSLQPFDLTSLGQGIVAFHSKSPSVRKVLVRKGAAKQYFTLPPGSPAGSIPLTRGSGDYEITLFEQVRGTTYRQLASMEVSVKLTDENAVFLQSVQPIAWNAQMEAIRKAKQLTANAKTDAAKVGAVYDYLTARFSYDYAKADGLLPAYYTPDVEATFAAGKGICYDAAALYAAMLRSVGVPVKLVKGYAPNIKSYHAWNEVYLPGSGWQTMDVTTDAAHVQAGRAVSRFKKGSQYKPQEVV